MFIITKNGCYFEIDETSFKPNSDELIGCQVYDSKTEMLSVVCQDQGVTEEEADSGLFTIKSLDGNLVWFDDRGLMHNIEEDFKIFIEEFEV